MNPRAAAVTAARQLRAHMSCWCQEIQAQVLIATVPLLLATTRCFCCSVAKQTFTINSTEAVSATGIIKSFIACIRSPLTNFKVVAVLYC